MTVRAAQPLKSAHCARSESDRPHALLASAQLLSFRGRLREVMAICRPEAPKKSRRNESCTRSTSLSMITFEKVFASRSPHNRMAKRTKRRKSLGTLIGSTILHYRILAELGKGGMGVVYRAEDTRLGRHVAVKFAPENYQANPAICEYFRCEAQTGSALNHPNLCTVYDVGDFRGRPFIVMELLEGHTLRQLMGMPMGLDTFLNLGMQMSGALCALHSKSIVHRDIKPSNIFVTSTGNVKIFDFGLATLVDAPLTAQQPKLAALRGGHESADRGRVLGTAGYMSPEQAMGEKLDTRTDLFSLGVVFYEMLTGKRPFRGPTTAAMLEALIREPLVSILTLRPDLPPRLDGLIKKTLEKDRTFRCQTADALHANMKQLERDLELIVSGEVIGTKIGGTARL